MREANIREDEGQRIRCDKARDKKSKDLDARLGSLRLDKRCKEKRVNCSCFSSFRAPSRRPTSIAVWCLRQAPESLRGPRSLQGFSCAGQQATGAGGPTEGHSHHGDVQALGMGHLLHSTVGRP